MNSTRSVDIPKISKKRLKRRTTLAMHSWLGVKAPPPKLKAASPAKDKKERVEKRPIIQGADEDAGGLVDSDDEDGAATKAPSHQRKRLKSAKAVASPEPGPRAAACGGAPAAAEAKSVDLTETGSSSSGAFVPSPAKSGSLLGSGPSSNPQVIDVDAMEVDGDGANNIQKISLSSAPVSKSAKAVSGGAAAFFGETARPGASPVKKETAKVKAKTPVKKGAAVGACLGLGLCLFLLCT